MPEKRRSLIDQLAAAKQRISELEQAELAQFYLSALVGSADDAIISKTLNGIVTVGIRAPRRFLDTGPTR